MIRSIHNVSLAEILPPSIAIDAQIVAIAKSLDDNLHRLAFESKYALHYPRLDELDHPLLDALAEQFNLPYYEPTDMELTMKRDLIRNSLLDHRIKGTPAAVENLLNKIVGAAAVKEWYEYGGKPFYFRINVKELKDFGDNGETFIRLINATKNARSWLDDLIFDLTKKPAPDETLHVAQLHNFQGYVKVGSRDRFNDNQRLKVFTATLTRGKQTFVTGFYNTMSKLKSRAGYVMHAHGRISFGAEIDEWDEVKRRIFDEWLKRRWQEFKNNAVIKHYTEGDDEGELEPGDEEFFPKQQDFLRLYWKFEGSNLIRYTTHYDFKADLQASDILAVSNTGEGILMHSRLPFPTTGILRALYVRKTETKII